MPRLNSGVSVALLAAAIAVGFGAGRWTASKGADVPPDDMAAAMRAALAESDVLDRLERTTRLLQHLEPDDLPEVVAIYDEMLPVLDQWDVRPFIVAWSRFDPIAAFDHALGWPNQIKQKVGAEAAIHGWALRDPLAARLAARVSGDSTVAYISGTVRQTHLLDLEGVDFIKCIKMGRSGTNNVTAKVWITPAVRR